jgi:hypothetical protein
VGIFFIAILLIIFCCYRHFFRHARSGSARHSQPFYSTDQRRAAPDTYYQGTRRSDEGPPPHYELAVRRQETHQMPQVQLDAVSSLVEQLRASHSAPT